MNRQRIFEDELALIKNDSLRKEVSDFLDTVPSYFFFVPASSTGKYHPSFSSGSGGLVRHTKMVVAVAQELLRLDSMSHADDVKDCIIAACILHDTFKHGYENVNGSYFEWTVESHPIIAADEWMKFERSRGLDNWVCSEFIYYCIAKHMGQWGPESALRMAMDDSEKQLSSIVHLADYIASRKFFDMYSESENCETVD